MKMSYYLDSKQTDEDQRSTAPNSNKGQIFSELFYTDFFSLAF